MKRRKKDECECLQKDIRKLRSKHKDRLSRNENVLLKDLFRFVAFCKPYIVFRYYLKKAMKVAKCVMKKIIESAIDSINL